MTAGVQLAFRWPGGESLAPLVVCYPALGMHYLVGADALSAFAARYDGMAPYPCKHLPEHAAKRTPAVAQREALA